MIYFDLEQTRLTVSLLFNSFLGSWNPNEHCQKREDSTRLESITSRTVNITIQAREHFEGMHKKKRKKKAQKRAVPQRTIALFVHLSAKKYIPVFLSAIICKQSNIARAMNYEGKVRKIRHRMQGGRDGGGGRGLKYARALSEK